MGDDIILAKDIKECEDCPLLHNDCCGGWTTNGNGTPIEPPCTSWNGDEEIYAGMYEYLAYERDYSKQELKWFAEEQERRKQNKLKQKELAKKRRLQRLVNNLTPYGISKIRHTPSICSAWHCNYCNKWVYPGAESWHDGIGEAVCYKCGNTMVHCGLLE